MTQPPSFEPRSKKIRPSSQGAREVGGSKTPSGQDPSNQMDEWNAIARAADDEKARRAERAANAAQASQAQSRQARAPHSISASSQSSSPRISPSPRPVTSSPVSPSAGPVSGDVKPHSSASSRSSVASHSSARPGGSAVRIPADGASFSAEKRRPSLFDSPQKPSAPSSSSQEGKTSDTSQASGRSSLTGPGLRVPNFSGLKRAVPRPRRWKRKLALAFTLIFVALIVWPLYLIRYGNSLLTHVDALSGADDTPGTTYLIVGSDKREKGTVYDEETTGERADTIMLLQVPESGNSALVSLPRDSYVDIPGHERGKLNSAFSLGGPSLLVQTVEQLSGLTVDHYVEVSMGGVKTLVDAVGGVNLCYDYDVDDPDSALKWTAGCHDVDGTTALAFSRMRKADPLGDIGRTARQRQVVAKVIDKAVSTRTLFHPSQQKDLVGAAASNLTTDNDSGITSLGRAGLGLRSVMKADGLMGAPPIANIAGRVKGQSVVLLDEEAIPSFFAKMRDGDLTSADFYDPTR